ncbi:unnamed protein product [Schistosoma margrebowiei]|uniref:Uncharacterized protein n=1 Tax=Schistosoma margrebowiei TaxID=48269 RepID=A0A183M5S5_9TREM|nr:unnamed protein product [Schistosoma margrebowiei]
MSASTSSLEQTDRSISTEFAQLIRTTETVRSTSTVKTTSPSSTTTSDDFGRSILFRQKSRVVRIYFHTWSHEI